MSRVNFVPFLSASALEFQIENGGASLLVVPALFMLVTQLAAACQTA